MGTLAEHRKTEQRRCVEKVMDDLHRKAPKDEDFAGLMRDLAICLTYELDRRHSLQVEYDEADLYGGVVKPALTAFARDEIERKAVMCQLLDKVVGVATSSYRVADKNRQAIAA